MTLLAVFFIMMLSMATIDAGKMEDMKKEAVKYFGGSYKIPYEHMMAKIKEMIKANHLEDKVSVSSDELGVTASFHGAVFFDSGKSEINAEGNDVLTKLGEIIKKEAAGFKIVVEGHTDDVPMQSDIYPSNWELSGARSARVVRMFETQGFDRTLMTPIGFSDTRPILPNRDEQGNPNPVNQSQNRRVVIKILK
jgi:chemotaxis protein MotB